MVQCAMRELKREDDSSFRNKKATTTLLALRLEDKIEGGKQSFRIDACEIGDSRWAMLCWDEKRKGTAAIIWLRHAPILSKSAPAVNCSSVNKGERFHAKWFG